MPASASSRSGWLSNAAYRTVLKSVPVATVDFILVRRLKNGTRQFLLGKRTESPYRGAWFIPGGRINRFERMENALRRKLKLELGIRGKAARFLGCLDCWNPPRLKVRWHSILHLYTVEVPADARLTPNGEHSALRWFSRVNPHWRAPVKQALKMAGFRK